MYFVFRPTKKDIYFFFYFPKKKKIGQWDWECGFASGSSSPLRVIWHRNHGTSSDPRLSPTPGIPNALGRVLWETLWKTQTHQGRLFGESGDALGHYKSRRYFCKQVSGFLSFKREGVDLNIKKKLTLVWTDDIVMHSARNSISLF